jgi:hypothetical protein
MSIEEYLRNNPNDISILIACTILFITAISSHVLLDASLTKRAELDHKHEMEMKGCMVEEIK